jgi:hypothetical protein
MKGNDVKIAQALLRRSPFVKNVSVTSTFDAATVTAVKQFQTGNKITASGKVDVKTASALLHLHTHDGWSDPNGALPVPPGSMYKVWIPVNKNRSIETVGVLFAANKTVLHRFPVRLQGQPGDMEFCSNGDTPTGYGLFDLNSPESDPVEFGPYPINRIAWGLKGNMGLLLGDNANTIRNGILLHTGEWQGWKPGNPMPRSHGCIHSYPHDILTIYNILTAIGVQMNKNPGGVRPYPFKPQGVISITLID